MTVEQKLRKPLTGEEYLASLRDGREVWLHGERVTDVTTHPAFRNSARSIARLYDALHDEKTKDVLTKQTDTGSESYTHKFFQTPKTPQDLIESRDAIAAWARLTYGQMGRTPDYKASFLATLGSHAEFYAPYSDNAMRWYKEAQEKNWFFNHAIVNPPIDRNKPVEEAGDAFIRVEEETSEGLIVSGSKMVATGSALAHYNFVGHYGVPIKKKEYAVVFIAPINAPGVKLISRQSYEMTAAVLGSPFDYPLSSRFDENDAVLVFDKVLIPWENVLIYGDFDKVNRFFPESGFVNRFTFHGATRLAVKLDLISGILLKALKTAGTDTFRGVQVNAGEVIAWRNLFWSITDAMALNPVPGPNGTVLPNMDGGSAYRVFMTEAWPRVKGIIEQIVGGNLIVQPSSARDFQNEELRPYLEKYYRGSNGIEALEKIKIIKLLWDSIGTEFGGRHELYERNYAGNHEGIRMETLFAAQASGKAAEFEAFAEECMNDYDLDGWKNPTWVNNDDIHFYSQKLSKTL
ncbi:Pyoverdin chromophore biosynthetic protein pvcC [Peribacillus asahii]|uniref:Pyoverdin chromophore biosynthetic protein pvcC n=1 Tax=Peribacillus asahii TaxID=228899 RepID=A0A398BD98_9BACI|nr:4-hydroxyphenylacetate 3-hydroxylase N-terminal domain-containing protein [Peribacillus asahii]RID88219.1 Pyoverdin chromophore biosynthetic protein pvcC [Peribacillus asahii]